MTQSPPDQPPVAGKAAPSSGAALGSAMGAWLKKNLRDAVISAVIGAVAGFAVSLLLPIVTGWNPAAAAAKEGPGGLAALALVWTLGSTVVFALIGYWRSAGTKRFFQAIARFPASIGGLFRAGGAGARVHLFWGMGLAFLMSVAVSPAVGAVVAVAVIASLPSVLGGVISNLLFRLWSTLTGLVSPTRKRPVEGAVMMAVGLLGSVLALAVGLLVTTTPAKVVLAVVCVGLALALGAGASRPKAD